MTGKKYLLHNDILTLELGELIGISELKKAFTTIRLGLKTNETGVIGYVSGLLVVVHSWSGAESSVVWVDSYHKTYKQVCGREISGFPMEISFEGENNNTQMKIKSTYTGTALETPFLFAYQGLKN